jgi:hypothetical protein
MSDESPEQEADEDVEIEVTPQAEEQIAVSISDLVADGYEVEPDEGDYVA